MSERDRVGITQGASRVAFKEVESEAAKVLAVEMKRMVGKRRLLDAKEPHREVTVRCSRPEPR
jgi:hypothetical protein